MGFDASGPYNTCAGKVIPCRPGEKVTVDVWIKGLGTARGTADCGSVVAACRATARFVPDDDCTDTQITHWAGALVCDYSFSHALWRRLSSVEVICTVG